MQVLIIGGTGYSAQHLLQSFAEDPEPKSPLALAFTHHSSPPPQPLLNVNPQALLFNIDLRTDSGLDAISHVLSQFMTKSFYKEEDETVPVNVYGKSIVEAEHYVSANCRNFAILRSSLIYGPQTISLVPKSLPIQVDMHAAISSCIFVTS
ncbi:UNVERIFIED_CONTAM: hypothetical protein Sradi_6887200 [Sesamum radiatum]|uniref:RmlD-like substrate binding domain-containing protein n=1 Tax=Sesamum radiatum TaxID=300843 RepID=A0AAW2JLF4_SESRA